MKAHIIFAHPSLQFFNGEMRNTATETLKSLGFEVSNSDLYQINFKASADEKDFTILFDTDYFDLQVEQKMALQNNTFSDDIKREHQLLKGADLIIFQFPLWWYSMPALMKGYIDRVFSMGFTYGQSQELLGKKVLVSMTTGAPDFAWTPEKRGTIIDIFKHLFVGTFEFCGLKVLEPFVVYGAKRVVSNEKIETLESYKKYLTKIKAQITQN